MTAPVLDAEIHPRLVSPVPDGNIWFAQQTTIPSIGFFTGDGAGGPHWLIQNQWLKT